MEKVQCINCKQVERLEWAEQGNHICFKITDPRTPIPIIDTTYKVGKYRFLKVKVK